MSLSLYKSVLDFVFPKDLLRYFDLVDVQSHDIAADKRHGLESGELVFYFDELDDFRCVEEGHTYRPNGFFEASKVHDFPLRDKKVTLVLRRRRWVDELTGKSVSNTYSLTTEGTRHSVEFAAFLKVLHPRRGNEIQRTLSLHLSTFC